MAFAELDGLPSAGALAVPVASGLKLPDALSDATADAIRKAATAARFTAERGKTLSLYNLAGYERVTLVGTGDGAPTALALQDLGGSIVKAMGRTTLETVSIIAPASTEGVAHPAAEIALGLQLGGYRFDRYKSKDEDDTAAVDTVFVVYSPDSENNAAAWHSGGLPVARGVYFARDLISEPGNIVYPQSFVERTRAAFRGTDKVKIRVLDEKAMEKRGMGALLGVGMGSARPPRLMLVEYRGAGPNDPTLAFVGKGVTFDTGGITLKRGSGMWKMKYDLSGAAAVTGAVLALAQREARVNAVAVAALVENMPSERAQRPGDVRRTMAGKTIEVLNTDAEGRLILADAVWYAQVQYQPVVLIDLATLTGSVRTALGNTYAGMFSRDDELAERLVGAGRRAGEEVWRLPLHENFRKALRSDIADIKNVAEGGGGASVGAEVIGTFVKPEQSWAHLDIASRAWQGTASPTIPKGAGGWGVRLLNQLVLDYYEGD